MCLYALMFRVDFYMRSVLRFALEVGEQEGGRREGEGGIDREGGEG